MLTSSTDLNSQVTSHGYVDEPAKRSIGDPFYRRLSLTDPLGNITWTDYSPGGTIPATVETYLNFPISNPTSTVDTLSTMDGLGRVIETEKRTAPGASTFDNVVAYGYLWGAGGPYTTQTTVPSGSAVTTT